MKYIKLFEEQKEEKKKDASYYRDIYNQADREIRYGCEDGIENFMKKFGLSYYYTEDSYNPPMFGKFPIYSIEMGRNGYISCEYFFAEGCFITELSNTPDDPVLSIVRARVEPGKTTKWHCLRGVTELYVILEGIGSVEVGILGRRW